MAITTALSGMFMTVSLIFSSKNVMNSVEERSPIYNTTVKSNC